MALGFKTRRTLANALGRTLREPRQLLALLIVLAYGATSVGMVVALLILPLPGELRAAFEAIVPGGLAAQLAGVRATLVVSLVFLAAVAAFQNPLLQFARADVDVLFATPIPDWRLMLDRLALNHLRALAAAYFFWGLALAPLLRLSGAPIWPDGAWALAALTCLFAFVDQGCAAGLLWLDRRGAARWLSRAGLVVSGLLLLGGVAAVLTRLLSGGWGWFGSLAGLVSGSTFSLLLLPVGLAADLLLLPTTPGLDPWPRMGVLAALDLASAALILVLGQRGLREAALSPAGRENPILEALAQAGPHPGRILRALWDPGQTIESEEHAASVPPSGRGPWSMLWVRLVELRRDWLRNGLAVVLLALLPLGLLLRGGNQYSLSNLLTAVIFSATLGTQLMAELTGHLRHADLELSLPVPRWQLLGAGLLARLAVYWSAGLLMLAGVALLQRGVRLLDLVAIALWYPLLLAPLLALRGALAFLFPAAALTDRRDPLQAVLVVLVNGLLTMGLLLLSLLPLLLLAGLADTFGGVAQLLWPVIYAGGLLLTCASLAILAWAYGRYEPSEG